MRTVEIASSLAESTRQIAPLSSTEVKAGTLNTKDITPKLIDAQIESTCSQLKHLESKSTTLRQMEAGDKQTDIYNFFEETTKKKLELFLGEKVLPLGKP